MRAKKFLILSIVSIFAALSFSFGGTSVAAAENETSDTLEMSMVCDWILDIQTHDYIKFEVIFKKDVFHAFPAGSEYRMLDGDDSQKAYMNNFTLCGKTFADINEEITAEDMADWEIAFFPATLGGVYLEPIIPHVHKPNQMQVCVHKEYVKMLTADITFGIVEGAQFTTQEGESYVAGDNLLFTLPEDVKESTTGAWDTEEVESPVDEERKVGMSSVTNMRRDGSMTEYYITELFFSRDVFRTDSMKNLDYSIMDGTHGNYYFIAEFFKINGKTVKQINLETDDSLYEYITFKNYGDSLKQPILLVSLQPNKMTIVEGDTSCGEDIYFYEFAPRTTTKSNVYDFGFLNTTYGWSKDVQDGGVVLWASYYDLMARIKAKGADSAYERLKGINEWYKKVQNAGGAGTDFYFDYYLLNGDGTAKYTLQQSGVSRGAIGLDREFLKNCILPAAVPYGFFGMDGSELNAISFTNNLPSALKYLQIDNMLTGGVRYSVRMEKNVLEVKNIVNDSVPEEYTLKFRLDKPSDKFTVKINGKETADYKISGDKIVVAVPFGNVRVEVK